MNKRPLKPSGSAWYPTPYDPATVPIPAPMATMRVIGRHTELDRKLWVFLVEAVWHQLEEDRLHRLALSAISDAFRRTGGPHDANWIYSSACRLVATRIEWTDARDDERYEAVASILSYAAASAAMLEFEFPRGLVPILKDPGRFARLRLHFLMGLDGKYAVSLYMLLQSVANQREPIITGTIEQWRDWLKVPPGKLEGFKNLKARALAPALEEINRRAEQGGLRAKVEYGMRGNKVAQVRMTVEKTAEKQQRDPTPGFSLSPEQIERAKVTTGLRDVYPLLDEWKNWQKGKQPPKEPLKAFIGFCLKKAARG